MKKNKLLQISTSDGLYLHGYYVPSESKKVCILHIHGFEANFYNNNFVYILANELEEKGIGFLTVNTRGNGKDTDFTTTNGKYKRIGSRYEVLEEAHLDISAWLKFLTSEGYKEIVLQGHSGGTFKVVRYLFEGELKEKVNKLILLSPIDPLGFRIINGRNDIEGFLKKAQVIVDEGKGSELITPEFDHDILSYKTFISWYKRDDLGRMFEFCSKNYDFPVLKKIKIPTKIIVGSKDKYFHPDSPEHPEEAMELLLKKISHSKGKIIEGAVHSFAPHEEIMAHEVSSFIG
jgi:pimeloyl-ACP methyl ester carboxylesterase